MINKVILMEITKKEIIETVKIILILSVIIIAFVLNLELGYIISDISGIPRDFSLSIISPGFSIEVAIILLVFEIVVFSSILEKFHKM